MEGRDDKGRFIAGHQHSQGRKLGSRNAITKDALVRLSKKFEQEGKHPVEGFYQLLNDPDASADLKFKIYSKMLDYTNDTHYIETDDEGNDIIHTDRSELLELVKQELES